MTLIRSAAMVSGLTVFSRILGYVRDLLMATIFGASPVGEAFVIAFRLPNLFRSLFAEGAFNAAFVPLFAKRFEAGGKDEARRFGVDVLSILLVTLVMFSTLAEIAMPWLVHIIAPGFVHDGEKFALTVTLTRIAFPYLLLISLVAFYSGVLNSLGRFFASAAAPIVLNATLIASLAMVTGLDWGAEPRSAVALAWGVAVAGVIQLVLLVAAARRAGMSFAIHRPRLTPGLRRLLRLGAPGAAAAGITQFNLLVGTMISSLQTGAPVWLYYAERLYQLPLALVGIAMGVVLLPDLARKLRAADKKGVINEQNRAVELSMLVTIPAAIALVAIPLILTRILFQHGAFSAADAEATAHALRAFALGLPAFVLIKVLSPNYFAHEDTTTPMLYAGIGMIVNVVGSLSLFAVLGYVGIALSTSLAAWINAGLLARTLTLRGYFRPDTRLKTRLRGIVLSSLIMGGCLMALSAWPFAGVFTEPTAAIVKIPALFVLVMLAVGIFLSLARLFGVLTFAELSRLIGRGGK
ncbi:MAG: murein biosynthesis integral membrane protein MurJ [Hyphomicrobiales bacterium]